MGPLLVGSVVAIVVLFFGLLYFIWQCYADHRRRKAIESRLLQWHQTDHEWLSQPAESQSIAQWFEANPKEEPESFP